MEGIIIRKKIEMIIIKILITFYILITKTKTRIFKIGFFMIFEDATLTR
jgi:hypothetical protein